jgi:hypothetical protein
MGIEVSHCLTAWASETVRHPLQRKQRSILAERTQPAKVQHCRMLEVANVAQMSVRASIRAASGCPTVPPPSRRDSGTAGQLEALGSCGNEPKKRSAPRIGFGEQTHRDQIGRTKPIGEIGRANPPPSWAQITRPVASSIRCMCSTLAASRMRWPSRAPASGLTRPQTSMPLMRKNTSVSMPSGSVTSIAASI